jgi:chromosome partitioning protein
LSIITIATTKGGAGKTTIARLILARKCLEGFKVAAVDSDFNHTLTDWLSTAARKYAIPVHQELDETKIVPLVTELDQQHDVVLVDTAGAAAQATIFAIGCADLVLVPMQPSSADVVEAIKTVNLIRSASQMLRREILARVVLCGFRPGTNIAEHLDREVVKANLPVMAARLNHAVALQEMSFTGTPPTVGTAGSQATAFLDEITHLGALPEPQKIVKLAS